MTHDVKFGACHVCFFRGAALFKIFRVSCQSSSLTPNWEISGLKGRLPEPLHRKAPAFFRQTNTQHKTPTLKPSLKRSNFQRRFLRHAFHQRLGWHHYQLWLPRDRSHNTVPMLRHGETTPSVGD